MSGSVNLGELTFRDVTQALLPDIFSLNTLAFGSDAESRIIGRLHKEGLSVCSLAAYDSNALVGHILFSHLPTVVDGRDVKALALAPMCVAPKFQKCGVGSALVGEGLKRVKSAGYEAVVVVGHPNYYPRFGFSAATAAHLNGPFSGPAFMVLELVVGALSGTQGQVRYPAAFEI